MGLGAHREDWLRGAGVETICIEMGLRQLKECVSLRDCVQEVRDALLSNVVLKGQAEERLRSNRDEGRKSGENVSTMEAKRSKMREATVSSA